MNKYSNFIANNVVTLKNIEYLNKYTNEAKIFLNNYKNIFEAIVAFEGCSFNHGIFRFHTLGSSFKWTKCISGFFPGYKNKIYIFGSDWMGRQFGTSLTDVNITYM